MTAPALAGLSDTDATRLRREGHGNDVRVPPSRTYAEIVLHNAFTLVNIVLFGVAGLLLWLGLPVDALVTAGPVLVYVAVSVAQEARAKRTLDQIALLARPKSRVIRAGGEREVDLEELVLGDLVRVRAGDQVPVDGEILDGRLEMDESLLTGESEFVTRSRGDRVLSGTVCGAGQAAYRVTAVGRGSMAAGLQVEARRFRDRPTPLQRDVGRTMAAVAAVVIGASLLVAIAFAQSGEPLDSTEAVQAAAVLVALVPQGLQMMIVLTYTLGALRLARRGAVVQRLGAVETMSRVDVLCLDKTGTLTTAAMEVAEVVPLAHGWDADRLRSALGAFAAAVSVPNRVIESLRRAAPAAPLAAGEEVDFRSDRRWSALRATDPNPGVWVLGAPDAVIRGGLGPSVAERVGAMTGEGLRVLCLAVGPDGPLHDTSGEPRLAESLEPIGLVALREQLRPDVQRILAGFAEARVELRLISGDAPDTVAAVATRIGLPEAEHPVLGGDLDGLTDAELARRVEDRAVIGRAEPALKARVVGALQKAGHAVGMVGDGVNDILAIKRADLGVALGSGAPATRSASDMVLLGDDFGLLPPTVIEGQRIVAGMAATLNVLLARTAYMVLLVAVAALLALPFPFTPRNNAILALLTVGIPVVVLALGVKPSSPPRHVLRATLRFMVPIAVATAALCLPVYAAYQDQGLEVARTALTSATVFCGLAILTLVPGGHPRQVGALIAAMAVMYLAVLAMPPVRDFFDLAPVALTDLALIAALVAAWAGALHLARRWLAARA